MCVYPFSYNNFLERYVFLQRVSVKKKMIKNEVVMINCSYVSNINRSVTGISVIKTIHLETAVRAK